MKTRILIALLGCLLLGCGKGKSDASKQHLKQALDNLSAAASPEMRLSALTEAAKASFAAGKIADAQKYADELMTLLPGSQRTSGYGNALHWANVILGRIAVREGRLDDAKRCLMESVRAPGAQQTDHGPSMSLAKDLLEKGERQAVLGYLESCKRFWDRQRLNEWSQQVKEGKTPDFSPTLL
jgi:hypothetical protein